MSTEGQHITLNIATNNGPLAQIWLAANMSNISRNSVLQTSIAESAQEIAKAAGCEDGPVSGEYITLRTSGELLQGIVRVYSKQAGFLLSDIKDTLIKISSLFKASSKVSVTFSKTNTVAKIGQLILDDAVTEKEVLLMPPLDFLESSSGTTAGILGHDDSMRRHVQGAAPWDTSLEVGRRFNPDEDFGQNSSGLDLDFDISGHNVTNQSKTTTWMEGTRNSANISTEHQVLPDNILNGTQDDDFPIEDADNVNWDLGVAENETMDDAPPIELGRRAEGLSMEESTDFGFNLDLEKDPIDENENQNTLLPLETDARDERSRNKRTKNPVLIHTIKIQVEEEPELSNQEMRDSTDTIQKEETIGKKNTTKMNQKRLWSEIASSLQFLPKYAAENLLDYRQLKKHKTEDSGADEFEEHEFDITLGLDDDLLKSSSRGGSSDNEEDAKDEDHILPMDNWEETNDLKNQEDMLIDTPNTSGAVLSASRNQPSKAVTDLAEILRAENVQGEQISFDSLIEKEHNSTHYDREESAITKREAASSFFNVLTLATAGCIDLEQEDPFSDIKISAEDTLLERFIAA
ncbi:kleisin alpha KNAG_0K01450 [Huiozyma naganishii CBS 8797]|uniref:Rad21/Rec8-like protein N-terminal domain-containing protein n=1 Tax=Huiozyma naganishii (strain ATCC MYA-139 / BCRC 22969 / CBS 8797 / KCTC 17520 / NBRC 10181 / NCYC 3082 / Yp74L-3) TaxID=1071383 RepID=J7S3B8_HUIN7|nr:hypothetical protein KNAG_0K01450 [Kazachstania naganishii CBS 8797]CCK72507.1 hypothetical protein KNAG_0K01450 [Kazachstania naganishii CBS 8797]